MADPLAGLAGLAMLPPGWKMDGSINGAFSAGRRTADTSYGLA
jgi:hypothetical protein